MYRSDQIVQPVVANPLQGARHSDDQFQREQVTAPAQESSSRRPGLLSLSDNERGRGTRLFSTLRNDSSFPPKQINLLPNIALRPGWAEKRQYKITVTDRFRDQNCLFSTLANEAHRIPVHGARRKMAFCRMTSS